MYPKLLDRFWLNTFYGFGILLLATILLSIYSENYYLLLIPCAFLFFFLSIHDSKTIYFILIAMLPLSIEVALPNGFATDFPTEPLIVGLMFLFIGYVLAKPALLDKEFFKSPVLFMLLIYYVWNLIATVYSSDVFISVKWLLAKTWYIVTFVFITGLLVKNLTQFKKMFWCFFLPLLFTVLYTLIRHARYAFSFETVNGQMFPFFRNHVNYACMVAEVVPFVVLAISWYPKGSFKKRFLNYSFVLILLGVYFAYTRSAWLALITALIMFFVIRAKWTKVAVISAFSLSIAFFVYMAVQNHYLNYAPNYETTVYHNALGEHLESTFEGQDVSSAERLYRWIAGIKMWVDKPWTGFGPGNFDTYYKSYTVNSFSTYVSANPERSSIHNYFLLILAEQGIIGLLLFMALTFFIFLKGQQIYNETFSKEEKRYVMAVLLSLSIIYVNTFLSDLIETDKIGSFYFINIALLINQDIRNKKLLSRQSLIS
ncbi:MAG: O-antigen ligase family protein [Chitinophagales bacterium]|nr:O-antigen ligase family protein [Chitinophagales bacterium]